jgi:transcriptional regulator with XRE-family HTH domain
MPSSNPARQAREALGVRLGEIRKDAGLTGRALAGLTGWHFTKVSKLENGVQNASEDDIRIWCEHCHAHDQISDLVATARTIDTMYVEWRRQLVSGTRRRQRESMRFEAETNLFRVFEPLLIPGILQTAEYAKAVLSRIIEFHDLPDDVEAGVQARMERQRILYKGNHRFHIVIGQAALTLGVVDEDVMVGQLGRLLTLSTLTRVHLVIIPTRAKHGYLPVHGFWVLDAREVLVETVSAEIKITQPGEVAVYSKAFERMASSAVNCKQSRALITCALDELSIKSS